MNYRELGKTPISESAPCGNDVRYEDVFETLQAEIDKLASPTERNSFSWEEVNKLSSEILREHSKDILVASYLCVSLLYLKGGEGLDLATAIYDDLIATFWEPLFPPKKRMRGRLGAIEWWLEKSETALENDVKPDLSDDTFQSIMERLERIDAFFVDQELDLSLISLISKVKNLEPVAESKPVTEAPKTGNSDPVHQETAAASLTDMEITNADEALKILAPYFQKIRQASKVVREDKSHNPQSYRWLRFALWEPVKSVPVSTGEKTKLPPPAQQMLAHIETLRNEEDWEGLLLASESALNNPKNIFLLDLNRFTAEALSALGRKHSKAHDTICHETHLFVSRLSGVEDLTFSDGTPFASDETKTWLGSLGTGSGETDSAGSALPQTEAETTINDFLTTQRQTIKETGNLKKPVSQIELKIRHAASGKEALLLRIGLVQILVSEKKEKLAMHHLETIREEIRTHRLDQWEPGIAIRGLKSVYTIYKKQTGKKYQEKADEVFNMIAGISTVDAMTL